MTAIMFIAIFVPWILGTVIISFFLRARNGAGYLALGSGYILGWFVCSLILRFFDAYERKFDIFEIVFSELILVILCSLPLISKAKGMRFKALKNKSISLTSFFVFVFLILLLFHFSLTAIDVVLKPIFPWDGWLSWSAKAKIFYYNASIPELHGSALPFWKVTDSSLFVHGARHPNFVPLIQAYIAVAYGAWDDNIVNLPWLGVYVGIGFLVYGGVRYLGGSIISAFLGSYLVLSLPILDSHVALGSYADVWVGYGFLALIFFTVMFLSYGGKGYLFLLLIFSVILYSTKNSSIIFLLVVALLFAWRFFSISKIIIVGLLSLLMLLTLKGWLGDEIANFSLKILSTSVGQIGYNAVAGKVANEWILFDNWHYCVAAYVFSVLLLLFNRVGISRYNIAFVLMIVAAVGAITLMLILTLFTDKITYTIFTGYFNRVSLYFMPVVALAPIFSFLLLNKRKENIAF